MKPQQRVDRLQQNNRNTKWRLIAKIKTESGVIEHVVKEMDLKEACAGASYFKELIKIHKVALEAEHKGTISDFEIVEPGVETPYEKRTRIARRQQKQQKAA